MMDAGTSRNRPPGRKGRSLLFDPYPSYTTSYTTAGRRSEEAAGPTTATGGCLGLVPCGPHDPSRGVAEQYVKDAFRRAHGAEVRTFMPLLLLLQDADGTLLGVVGVREARHERLYLERYLDGPVERVASERTGIAVRRRDLVEIGNLACRDKACAQRLLALLPWFLLDAGYRWIAFTGTRAVREMVQKLGATLIELAPASATQVADAADLWGAYYEHDPRVVIGFLPQVRHLPAFRAAFGRD